MRRIVLIKRTSIIGFILLILLMGACSNNEEQQTKTEDEVPEIVEVDLTVPTEAEVGTEVVFTAVVTQGEELVDDAHEVEFEIMNLTSEKKEMIEASLNEDKHYSIPYTFETSGTYDITSHVTARDMHTMPNKQIVVTGGEESTPETEGHSHGENHHHDQKVTIEFSEGSTTVGEEIMLETILSLEDVPLEGACVQYDISRSDVAHHTWLEAPEVEPGVYQVAYTFTESGSYEIEVHVTKGEEIHDHLTKTYTVK